MKRQIINLSIVASTLLTLSSTLIAQENLIQNGSFENYTAYNDHGSWKEVTFSNWNGNGEVWNSKIGQKATNGEHKIELDLRKEVDELSQSVTTVKDKKYKLSIDAYARRKGTSDFQILIDGEVVDTITPDRKWAEYSIYFIGTGGEQRISIKELDSQNNGLGAVLDNVQLYESKEMLLNGSFENFTINKDRGKWKLVNFDGWEGAGEAWNNRLGKRSTKGAYKIELDVGKEFNSLSQMVTTQNKIEYELSLDAYARRVNSSDFEIWVDDKKLETIKPTTEWKNYKVAFFGNGQAQKIQIKELASQSNGYGAVIDNVSMQPTGKMNNRSPLIEGEAQKSVNAYSLFSFQPIATDVDGDVLTFSIENKPDWAEFNTTTGLLSGTPTTVGLYSDINISVSDDNLTTTLEPFSIEVTSALDIAHKYGKATQGTNASYHYYEPASYAIDNNDSTINHTRGGKNGENWLQIELPSPTKISKIIIQHRNGNTYRLTNAKVYISDTPFVGTVDENNLVKTLEATNSEQVIEFSTPMSGTYLLIKGEQRSQDDRHLHLRKVEVYGDMPKAPTFTTSETSYLISGTTTEGEVVATVNAVDYQEDSLTYNIVGTVPFAIDAQGNIRVDGTLSGGTYSFEVEVSDGVNVTRQTMTIEVTSSDVIADVLASGDVVNTKVTQEELVQATLDEIEATRTFMQDAKVQIFNLNSDGTVKSDGTSLTSIDWTPTHDASVMLPTLGKNSAFLYTNAVEREGYTVYHKPMGTIGQKDNGRYVVFGSNPLRNGVNDEMNQVLENSMAWLTKRDDLKTAPFNVVIAHLDESYWFRDESATRTWLDTHYTNQVTYNSENSCDGVALSSCLDNNPDLLIISQVSNAEDNVTQISNSVNQALANGTPVLYVHHDGNQKLLGKALFSSVFDVTYSWDNYWKKLKLESYNPTLDLGILPERLASIKTMFTHFKNNDYAFDWTKCNDGKGNYGTKYDNCSEVVGLNSEFQEGANEVRKIINSLDNAKKDIFEESGYKFQKLLTLTADKFRQSVSYPMDKVTTDDNEFMKSYYADHAIYNYRKINPTQPNMGNFSGSDFSAITPTTRVVNMQSKRKFRATGAYALPGETVRVTRSDSSDLSVKVFINSLRSGATHQYQKNAYNRPKYLQTPHFEIKSGESIEITSPYGGPIQLEFSKNDLPVNITFENVGEHPFWASSADNASFTQKLDAGNYNWAEIATEGFTVHSKLDKMRQSVADTRWGGTAEGLANAVVKYTSNYPHVLAGFKGDGVDVVPEIHDWAEEKGLTIETIDIMKHMNADQATCGYGCSGNPYDAYWAFNPIGHGDIHEMGHSMQKMRFEGFPNHAATNTFSYYTKLRYFENTGEYGVCQKLPFKKVFDKVQASVNQTDPKAYLQKELWDNTNWPEPYVLKMNAMMHAQKLGKVQNGWHVLARVHILEREMRRAKKDWEARKASMGFSTYSLDEINNIRNNDWLTIAYSYASEVDLRDYFDMMGIPFSQKAHDQIASFGFDKAPKSLFVSTDTGYCQTDDYGTLFDRETLPMDGNTSYIY